VSDEERAFLSKTRDALDASVDAIDPATRTRLRAARARALADARAPRRWLPVAGFAAAASAVVAIAVWRAQTPAGPDALIEAAPEPIAGVPVEPIPLAAADDLDLYLDLDFFTWLAEEGDAG